MIIIRKDRESKGICSGGNSIADSFYQVINNLHTDPFVQNVSHNKKHVPSIILYTEEQISDVRRFCASGPVGATTVLGIDKTYNLGPLHVTPTVFKHLGIVRMGTSDHPIFPGPILIHGNSDYLTFASFLHHIADKLDGNCSIVIGSDEELAIRKAAALAFPDGHRLACELHMEKNCSDYLKDMAVNVKDRDSLVKEIFGKGGLTSTSCLITFDEN